MLPAPVLLAFLSGLLLIVTAYRVYQLQSRADQCDRHHPRVGRTANALAIFSFLLGCLAIAAGALLALQSAV